MIVKTFHGRTCSDALGNVRELFGPEAAILETRTAESGVEVVAAVEREGAASRPSSALPPAMPEPITESDWIVEALADRGFSPFLSERIATAARSNLDEEQLFSRETVFEYARGLVALWVSTENSEREERSLRVILGATGSGKTTTTAKLAALEAVSGRRNVVIASADDRRLGGAEQLEAFARLLGVPFHVVRNRQDLDRARITAGDRGCVFLDTPGVARTDRRGLDRLAEITASVSHDEKSLLLAADQDAATLNDVVQRFRPVGIGSLLATRTDEAVRRGSVVTAIVRSRLPLRHVANGPEIPDDISTADARQLAHWALPSPEERA